MYLSSKSKASCSSVENVKDKENTNTLLDLPERILECIFERLLPADLCNMIEVCSFFREICASDHLWEQHLTRKWGKVIGDAAYRKWIGDPAYREWQSHVALWTRPNFSYQNRRMGLFNCPQDEPRSLASRPKPETSYKVCSTSLPAGSVKAFYLALESGKFWFPVQVYHTMIGNAGLMLFCKDTQVRYDYQTDSFRERSLTPIRTEGPLLELKSLNSIPYCRYPSQVWGTTEAKLMWNSIRAPPVDTPPFTPHESDSSPCQVCKWLSYFPN